MVRAIARISRSWTTYRAMEACTRNQVSGLLSSYEIGMWRPSTGGVHATWCDPHRKRNYPNHSLSSVRRCFKKNLPLVHNFIASPVMGTSGDSVTL